jgi:hypothetical protein
VGHAVQLDDQQKEKRPGQGEQIDQYQHSDSAIPDVPGPLLSCTHRSSPFPARTRIHLPGSHNRLVGADAL